MKLSDFIILKIFSMYLCAPSVDLSSVLQHTASQKHHGCVKDACQADMVFVKMWLSIIVGAALMMALMRVLGHDPIRENIYNLRSRDIKIRQKSAALLQSLALKSSENRVLIANAGGVEALVALLRDEHAGVRKCAAGALRNLAMNAENQVLIAQAGAIAPLISQLRDADVEVRQKATVALWSLAANPENQILIAAEGGVEVLIHLLADVDVVVRQNTAGALLSLALNNNQNQLLIAQAGGIQVLVALLRDADTVVRQQAAGALLNLSSDHMNKALIAQARGIPLLVALLGDPAREVRKNSVGTLLNLSLNHLDNKILIAQVRGVEPLVALMRDGDVVIRQRASATLLSLSIHAENQVLIIQAGGMTHLVNLLCDVDAVVRQNAAGVLGKFAMSVQSQSLIMQAGGMTALVKLLCDTDAGVRQNAAGALGKFAMSAEGQSLIVQALGIEPLVDLLRDTDAVVRKNAIDALWNLAPVPKTQALVVQTGAVASFAFLLRDADSMVRQQAAGVLGYLAYTDENQILIAHEGGIPPLLAVLGDADAEVRQKAALAVLRLALNAENQVLIAQMGGIKLLVSLLSDADAVVREIAAGALGNLAVNAENQLLIIQAGGFYPLSVLLREADAVVREVALATLGKLLHNPEGQLLIANSGGIKTLVELLRDIDVTTRCSVVKVLRTLVNVSLWYDQDIAMALESEEKKEHDAELKEDIQYILSHWKKKQASPTLNPDVSTPSTQSTQDLALASPASQELREHLSSQSEVSEQKVATGIQARIIEGSEVHLGRRLGRGAFGEVYEAMYHFQKVAVKKYFGAQLRPNDRAKIIDEILLMAELKHKYLVAFLGVIEEASGIPSLVMECAEQGSLYDYLGAHRDIAWSWRLRVADELARGLAYLHQKNLVHRDIKSLNVVLDEDFHAKWCDFGLAVLKQHATATQTHHDQAAGTARWMAPELFEDEPVISRKADIWSYGMVLFELATQTVPYHSLNEKQVLVRLMKHKAEEVPEECRVRLPKFAALMKACWNIQEERPEASRLVEVLTEVRSEYLEEETSVAIPESLASGFVGLSSNF